MNDPELEAMGAVADALASLDEEQQGRVLRWAGERFDVALAHGRSRGPSDAGEGDPDGEVTDEEVAEATAEYEDFADFFGAASPEKNEDKALVAAYWVQVIQGNDQWASRLVNNELKDLGHPIANITDALSSNIKKKPQRVRQVRKNGTSKQGTKTYKVTHEGQGYVQGLLSRSDD